MRKVWLMFTATLPVTLFGIFLIQQEGLLAHVLAYSCWGGCAAYFVLHVVRFDESYRLRRHRWRI